MAELLLRLSWYVTPSSSAVAVERAVERAVE
jgi:hypothetical protein